MSTGMARASFPFVATVNRNTFTDRLPKAVARTICWGNEPINVHQRRHCIEKRVNRYPLPRTMNSPITLYDAVVAVRVVWYSGVYYTLPVHDRVDSYTKRAWLHRLAVWSTRYMVDQYRLLLLVITTRSHHVSWHWLYTPVFMAANAGVMNAERIKETSCGTKWDKLRRKYESRNSRLEWNNWWLHHVNSASRWFADV